MEIADYQSDITPLRHLIGQAGLHGYLLLASSLLYFFTARGRTEGYDSVDTSSAIQAAYAVLIFIYSVRYLMLPCGNRVWLFLFSRPMVYLTLFILMCIFSSLWSEKPIYSAFMGFQCLAFLMLLTVILDRLMDSCTAQDVVEWMMLWMVWRIFWGVVWRIVHGQLYYNIFATERLQTGIFFFLAIYISRRKIFRWIVMAFGLFSGSNKMYAGMVPGALMGIFSQNKKIQVLSYIGAFVLISGLIYFGLEPVLQRTVFRGRAGVGMQYTSGRDTMWEQSMDIIREKPFLGHGFVSGERDRVFVGGINTISVHNMMLSAAISVGIIGPLLLFLFFLETSLLCFSKNLPRDWLIGFLATIGISFVFSMTAPGLGG
ncbi:O-antigen ligase family protein, partial [bacterium]|nr:O-antigen ligase family protein [bacterium]